MSRAVIFLYLFIGMLYADSMSDELKIAREGHKISNGGSIGITLTAAGFMENSSNTLGIFIPISKIVSLKPELGIVYGSDYIDGFAELNLLFGAPPSKNNIRLYGGPKISITFPNRVDYYIGGGGGVEFFGFTYSSAFIEFGYLGGTYFKGGFKYYFQ